jgi:hypothetical protein
MRKAVLLALALVAAPAFAQGVAVKSGDLIVTADGKRLGRVDTVTVQGGAPYAVSVIYDSKFVKIPVSTLTSGEGGRLQTSLSRDDVRKLK